MPDSEVPSADALATELGKGERTRLRIAESACRLFLNVGYHGTSMRQIAQAADLALGSIYNHFATKEEIFVAVLEMYHPWREIPSALEAAQGETPETLMRDVARRILESWKDHSDLARLHSIEQLEFQGQHLLKLFDSTVDRITQAREGSRALQAVPTALLVRALFGLFFAYLASEEFTRAGLPIDLGESAVTFFTDAYLQGLLGPAPETQAKPVMPKVVEARPVPPRPAETKPSRKWH